MMVRFGIEDIIAVGLGDDGAKHPIDIKARELDPDPQILFGLAQDFRKSAHAVIQVPERRATLGMDGWRREHCHSRC